MSKSNYGLDLAPVPVKISALPPAPASVTQEYVVANFGTSNKITSQQMINLTHATGVSSSFNITWSLAVSPTVNSMSFFRSGAIVTVAMVPAILISTSANLLIGNSVPVQYRPVSNRQVVIRAQDDGTTNFAVLNIANDGTITVGKTKDNLPFSGIGNIVLYPSTFSYLI